MIYSFADMKGRVRKELVSTNIADDSMGGLSIM